MIRKLKELEKEIKLSAVHKIILTTDGSITRILEALGGGEVEVRTREQKVIKAGKELAKRLGIKEGEGVNYRVVDLYNPRQVLVHAISYTPIHLLKMEFKAQIMKEDAPIGKIMARLKIEARREIRGFEVVHADGDLSRVFAVPLNSILLKRNYDIIHDGRVMMNIIEIFPYEAFAQF